MGTPACISENAGVMLSGNVVGWGVENDDACCSYLLGKDILFLLGLDTLPMLDEIPLLGFFIGWDDLMAGICDRLLNENCG